MMVRILLADNHIVIRSGLRAFLQTRRNFHICGETHDGQEALDLAVLKKPDVVVINVNLPVINGIAATRQIRRAVPGTEILIYTAESNDDLIREVLSAGALGYVLKSAPDQQIIEAVGALARHHPFCSSAVSQTLLFDLTMRAPDDSNGVHLTTRERGSCG
jgi:DNA-binding NarL/FixJ family response regulator